MNRHEWRCNVCHAVNSREDGECQFCECGGVTCKRDNCSGVHHNHPLDAYPPEDCQGCGTPTNNGEGGLCAACSA